MRAQDIDISYYFIRLIRQCARMRLKPPNMAGGAEEIEEN